MNRDGHPHRAADYRAMFIERFYMGFVPVHQLDPDTGFGQIGAQDGPQGTGSVDCVLRKMIPFLI